MFRAVIASVSNNNMTKAKLNILRVFCKRNLVKVTNFYSLVNGMGFVLITAIISKTK